MSGQRNKKPSDVIKARQEYLDNLSLEVQLNDANEQAVKQYKETGQVPPISQMKDTRSTSQILADVEKLKINLIKDLEPIADPQFAQLIIGRLIQSPLNIDNGLLIFTSQRIDEIVKNLKKLYKYGIKGDINDAETFVSFINKMYTDRNKSTESIKSFMNRSGISSSGNTLSNSKTDNVQFIEQILSEFISITKSIDFESNRLSQMIYIKIQSERASGRTATEYIKQLGNINNADEQNNKLEKNIDIKLRSLLRILPTPGELSAVGVNSFIDFLREMDKLIIDIQGDPRYNYFTDKFEQYLYFINHNIPNLDYSVSLINNYSKEYQNLKKYRDQNNFSGLVSIFNTITQILNGIDNSIDIDLNEIRQIETIFSDIKEFVKTSKVRRVRVQPREEGEEKQGAEEPKKWYPILDDYEQPIINRPVLIDKPNTFTASELARKGLYDNNLADISVNLQKLKGEGAIDNKDRKKYEQEFFGLMKKEFSEANLKHSEGLLRRVRTLCGTYGIAGQGINAIDGSRTPSRSTKESYGKGINLWDSKQTINPVDYLMPKDKIKYRMVGKGLPMADYNQGIDPSPRYIKFGRYMINNKKLNDNVLSLRRSRGSTIATIPATKMTSELGGVIKKIVGGGVPSFDELNALTDAEKRYLYKVSQEADIYDKIKIPTPSKDEEEKDIHAFNVMKGEILAGNNSKELVAKFKALLNKLSKNNILPKSQVREILEELLELGY